LVELAKNIIDPDVLSGVSPIYLLICSGYIPTTQLAEQEQWKFAEWLDKQRGIDDGDPLI
jgi:hypothetical protein